MPGELGRAEKLTAGEAPEAVLEVTAIEAPREGVGPGAGASVAAFALHGELDLYTAPVLQDLVREELTEQAGRRPRPLALVLDFSGVRFIDSAGLAAVLGAHKAAKEGGGCLVLVGTQGQVRRTLGLMRIEHYLNLADSTEEACGQMRAAGVARAEGAEDAAETEMRT